MDNYDMIFKRKSFHLFRNIGNMEISSIELEEINNKIKQLIPLFNQIKTSIKIVPASKTTCKRGQEYCILFYSEKKEGYLQNIGYLGEQLDLYLVSKNIGTLYFGIGKIKEESTNGLEFTIMMAISKVDNEDKFRKDMFKSKRKKLDEIWVGKQLVGVSEIVRFAPSACNTQPWIVENIDNTLKVYRYKKAGKRGIMPANKVSYYNQIDIGIFLYFLEVCLIHQKVKFKRENYIDNGKDEKALNAIYYL